MLMGAMTSFNRSSVQVVRGNLPRALRRVFQQPGWPSADQLYFRGH